MSTVRISIVSHHQEPLVRECLRSIATYCAPDKVNVTVTVNGGNWNSNSREQSGLPVDMICNTAAKGFGANHNQAFATCEEEYFCVLNPDILFIDNPFPLLIASLADTLVGVAGPVLTDSVGVVQDSARLFPTPARIFRRILFRNIEYPIHIENQGFCYPDWIAGMFMLFPAALFRKIGGFDEGYFMYCEDADICCRLKKTGYRTLLEPQVKAIHNAQRSSHRTMQHFRWHVGSLMRFFFHHPYYRL